MTVHLFELQAQVFLWLGCWVGPLCKYLAALCPSPELVWSAEEAGSFTEVLGPPPWWAQQGRARLGAGEKLSVRAAYLAILVLSVDLEKGHCSHIYLVTQS